MTSSRWRLLLILYWLATLVSSNPLPFSKTGRSPHDSGDGEWIRVQQLYRNMTLQDIPTTVAADVILTNCTSTRYGYHMGRPVDRLYNNPVGRLLKPFLGQIMSDMHFIQHWGVLISTEVPFTEDGILPRAGSKVPRPETGLIYELRNSANTGLVYLDLKNWTTYPWRYKKVRYLGTLNKTDEQLIMIGRAYIQHVGKEGFHNFYRNCQHFATWYSNALWPKVPLARRVDQILGKALWWFRDTKKTAKWGLNRFGRWLGIPVADAEAVDSAAEFVELDKVLSQSSNHSETVTAVENWGNLDSN